MALDDDGKKKPGADDEDDLKTEDAADSEDEEADDDDFEDDDDDLSPVGSRSGAVRFFVRTLLVVGGGLVVVGLSLLLLFGFANIQTSGGFFLAGLLLLVVYGVLEPETVRGFLGQGQLQAGSKALLGVLLVVGAVFLLNVVVRDRLGDKQIDVTKDRVNSLAPQTETVVKGLDNDVTVTVWWNQSPSETQTAYDLLQRMHNLNHKLVVKQKSLIDDPTTATKLGLQQASVVFEYPNRQPQVATDLTEAGLDTALIRLSTGKTPKVYFVTGHGEGQVTASQAQNATSYSRLVSSLATQGITTAQLNLLTGSGSGSLGGPGQVVPSPVPQPSTAPTTAPADTGSPAPGASPSAGPAQVSGTSVPTDADAVVILDPTTNLTQAEVDALKAYLDGGGHVLVSAPYRAQTNINDVLSKYGISIGAGPVLDSQLQYNQIAVAGILVIQQYGQHVVTRGLDTTPTLVVQDAPVEGQASAGYQLTGLVATTNKSCERLDANQQAGTCQPGDKPGPFNLIVAVEQTNAQKDTKPTRLIVMGGAQLVSDQILNSQLGAPGNLAIMNNAVNWLAGQDKIIDVPVRATQPNAIFVTDAQHQLILIGYTLLLPLFVAALGVAVYLRRR